MNNKDKKRYFKTSNLNLSIYLYANNQQICGIDTLDRERKEFVFLKTDFLEELAYLYKFGDKDDNRLSVLVHKYEQARRELLDKLNN